jgi:hypothetical protein
MAASVLALPLALALPESVRAATYVAPCGSGARNDTTFAEKQQTTGTLISGVTMDFYARTLRACTSPANGFGTFDYPAVLLALQSTPSTQTNIVHIGYLICNRPAGCPGNIPNDGAPHFVYTRGDNDAGSVWLLDTYYHAPVIGHQYPARISHGTSGTGNPIWLYCLRDLATEADYTCHGGGQTDGSATSATSEVGAQDSGPGGELKRRTSIASMGPASSNCSLSNET